MKVRWIPFLATTAALALAMVAPAQDRGHSRSSGGERSRGSESSSRGRDRSGGDSGSRSRDRGSSPSRSTGDRSGGDRSGDRTSGPSRDRSDRSGGDRSDRSGGDRTGGGSSSSDQGRRNPFDRSRDRDRSPSSPSNDSNRRDRDRSPSTDQTRRDPFQRERGRDRDRDRSPGGFPSGGGNFPSRDRNDRNDNRGGDNRDSNPFSRGSRGRVSHSGPVRYGSNYNGFGRVDRGNYRIGHVYNHVTLGEQVRRAGSRPGYSVGFYGGLRLGYVHYNRYWRDDNFCYPFYAFDPWAPGVTIVCSPWYRYAYLPPYVNTTRVVVVNNYNPYWDWDGYDTYRYSDRRNLELNDALDDIRDAFDENSTRYAEHLVPQDGQVAIFNDGKYDYSVGINDFEDMFFDGVEQSKTISYDILEVRTRGNEAKIRARHTFEDPYGDEQSVIHTFTLIRERGDYVIREFGTEN